MDLRHLGGRGNSCWAIEQRLEIASTESVRSDRLGAKVSPDEGNQGREKQEALWLLGARGFVSPVQHWVCPKVNF